MLRRTIHKAIGRVNRKMRRHSTRKHDLTHDTRLERKPGTITHSYVRPSELDFGGIDSNVTEYLTDMYLNHRFDLLGSGWVANSYSSVARGLEGHQFNRNANVTQYDSDGNWLTSLLLPSHLELSRKIWQGVSPEYRPIDWQKDFKSGYRWSAGSWSPDQPLAPAPGVDIKVPWELARLEHLPRMALLAFKSSTDRNRLIAEFRNQVLDFQATNPPRMGVNWVSTMDVAIRAANLALAYDLFTQLDSGHCLDDEFRSSFTNSLYEHGLHIVNNLEWYEKLTTNHYLANIAGLLFVAAYLPGSEEVDCWLAFALQELEAELDKQFYADGGNHEASTSYHILATEMMVYSTALALGLPEDKQRAASDCNRQLWQRQPSLRPASHEPIIFPDWYQLRLRRASDLCQQMRKPTGEFPQIGDNDSGRFFKLTPVGEFLNTSSASEKYLNLAGYDEPHTRYWDEQLLNPGHLIASASALFGEPETDIDLCRFTLEHSLVSCLSNNTKLNADSLASDIPAVSQTVPPTVEASLVHTYQSVVKAQTKMPSPLTEGLKVFPYVESGLLFLVSDRLHLTISIGGVGQRGFGGHSHNDKLSFELNLDSSDRVVDPGTYLYLPLPERRNQFRSSKAHHGPQTSLGEPNRFRDGIDGVFGMPQETECRLIELTENSALLLLSYREVNLLRKFTIDPDAVIIADRSNVPLEKQVDFELYSRGYGKLQRISATNI